eukprot:COSAG02_NODE_14301_length_1287_cov_2.109428_1_plen_306_part_10
MGFSRSVVGIACLLGMRTAAGQQDTCESDSDCPDSWCNDGLCYVQILCSSDDECGPCGSCDFQWGEGECWFGSACTSDQDCYDGYTCDTECGSCVSPVHCTGPWDDCPAGLVCSEEDSGLWVCLAAPPPPPPPPPPPRTCADTDADGTPDNFDCSGETNDLDASPADVMCAPNDPCTAAECCTVAPPPPTCSAAESETACAVPTDGTPVGGEITSASANVWFVFDAVGGRGYQLDTQLNGTLTDSVLDLVNTDGNEVLGNNDDCTDTLASCIGWQAQATGTYYAMVRAYGEEQTGTFFFTINEAPP